MPNPLEEIWDIFAKLKKEQLNPPATDAELQAVEYQLGFALPEGLKDLYRLANGQRNQQDLGIFKNVSGANVYSRVWFITAAELPDYYHLFCENEELLKEFGKDFLPFAVEGEEYLGYCYAISIQDGSVHILWTDFPDPFLPVDWQLCAFKRGDSVLDFLKHQNTLLF